MNRFYETKPLPNAFIWRRLQSLMGLWLVLFLIEHLLTNSQAALPLGDDGSGFVRSVNAIKNLPYLQAIEITLLGVPFFVHMVWGIKYLLTSKINAYSNTGKDPYFPHYPRNHAYSWQRITSWILLILVIGHVVQMRFINYPASVKENGHAFYFSRVHGDEGLSALSKRLNVQLYDANAVKASIQPSWKEAALALPLSEGQLLAVSPDFGTASLLLVRETFKQPLMIFLYTVLVLAAVYHAFNGLWTFCITWGITLTARSQMNLRRFAVLLMILIGALGLAAVWGTYFINLKQ